MTLRLFYLLSLRRRSSCPNLELVHFPLSLFLPQPRPQGPPREPTKNRHSSGASHAEGPGNEVVSSCPSPLQAAYSSIGLMTHFPLCNFFFSHFPYGLMARCSFYLLFLLSYELMYHSSLRSSRNTHKLN